MKKFLILSMIISLVFVFKSSNLAFSTSYPQRIISLSPRITEEIYLLKAEDRLVGSTIYCKRPKEAKTKEEVGTIVNINLEKILSLKPDVVFATSLTNPKEVKKLKDLGIRVEGFPYQKNFFEMSRDFVRLGKIIGKEEEAKGIVKKAHRDVISIKKKTKGLSRPKVIVQIGAKPLWVATRDSFINDFIEFGGGINVGPSKRGPYSREKVLKDNPDVIIITTMGMVSEEERKIWQKYKTINAVKNNRIYIFDAYKLCSPTMTSFVETLKEIEVILHPNNE